MSGGGGSTASKGPSPGDTSLSNPWQTVAAGPEPSYNAPPQTYATPPTAGPEPGTGAAAIEPNVHPSGGINLTVPTGGGYGAIPTTPSETPSTYATIANPSGGGSYGGGGYGGNAYESGAPAIQTYGQVGQVTGPGLAGVGGSTAPGLPPGISPQLAADPTQQYATATPTTQATTAAAAAPSGGTSGFSLESLVSGITKPITSNPLGFLGGLGSLYNAYKQNQAMQNIPKLSEIAPQLAQQASQLNEQGQQLASYLTQGDLPPGLKASLEQATKAAKMKIISNMAAQGMPTDPTKNSTLAQELAAVDTQAVITTAQIGQNLMQSGLTASELSSNLYKTLANIDQTQTQQIGQSIARFASAISPTRSAAVKAS